jgi:hypothetical protein
MKGENIARWRSSGIANKDHNRSALAIAAIA